MKQSSKVALGGMLAALSVVILLMAGVVPLFLFAFPALAGLLLLPMCAEGGWKWGLGVYATASLLAILLCPDREVVFYYVCLFGHYPVLKILLDKIRPRLLRILAKAAAFLLSAGAALLLTLVFFGAAYLKGEYVLFGTVGMIIYGLVALLALFAYDNLLGKFTLIYLRIFRKKLAKIFHLENLR